MTFSLDLRISKRGPHHTLIDGFPFRCGWCTARFFTARELVAHVRAMRAEGSHG